MIEIGEPKVNQQTFRHSLDMVYCCSSPNDIPADTLIKYILRGLWTKDICLALAYFGQEHLFRVYREALETGFIKEDYKAAIDLKLKVSQELLDDL